MPKLHSIVTRAAGLACCAIAPLAAGQATVEVGDGENLSQTDLENGSFMGQSFALDPLTTFEINSGGSIGNVEGPFSFGGATVNINEGGTFVSVPRRNRSFFADVVLNITSGGALGDQPQANFGSLVNLDGGTIGERFQVTGGAEVRISDGSIGDNFFVFNGANTVDLSGGSIGNNSSISDGAVFTMSGGSIGNEFGIFSSPDDGLFSIANISGGTIGDEFSLNDSSTLNLFVTEATVDGVPLPLTLGSEFVVSDRGGALLEGTLADGSAFDFILNDLLIDGEDSFDPRATLTVTLVPAPGAVAMLGLAASGLALRRRR